MTAYGPGTNALSVSTLVQRGTFTLDAALHVAAGETLALLGPNGSGKSTLLAVVAGLLRPQHGTVQHGTVQLGERLLTRVTASEPIVHVAPERRRVGLLGQEPLLFPHLTALENVAFGPRSARTPKNRARADAAAWLDAVGLAPHARARPAQLSGGQRQRVALARALAARPHALLLDEPFAALDIEAAADMRSLLREHLADHRLTTVLVTHDAADAALLADRIALLHDGRIVQHGPTSEVLAAPTNDFAAALVGATLIHSQVDASGRVALPGGALLHPADPLPPGTHVTVTFSAASGVAVSVRSAGSTPERPLDRPATSDQRPANPRER